MPVKKTAKQEVNKTVANTVKKPVEKVAAPVAKKGRIDPKFEVYRKLLLGIKEKTSGDLRNLSDDNKGGGNDGGGDISGHALHMADVATDMYDREFTLGLAANERELLYEVDEALIRIQEGTFGICTSCKKPIPPTRLKAIPHAKLCLKCQEKSETRR